MEKPKKSKETQREDVTINVAFTQKVISVSKDRLIDRWNGSTTATKRQVEDRLRTLIDNHFASITVPAMTLTLKNVPQHIHRSLKTQAQRHKRSLNQEAILCLEIAVKTPASQPSLTSPPPPISAGKILQPFSSRAEMLEGFLDSRTQA